MEQQGISAGILPLARHAPPRMRRWPDSRCPCWAVRLRPAPRLLGCALHAAQVAARIAYEEYVAKLSTGLTEHNREPCSSFRFQSSLFVLAGTPWLYDGSYAPQPMLQLPRLQKLQVGKPEEGCRGAVGNGRSWKGASIVCGLQRCDRSCSK